MAYRVSDTLCQIYRNMPFRNENIDFIKINLPVLEQLLSIDDYFVQVNVLEIIEIICKQEFPPHMQAILDADPIMEQIAEHLRGNNIRLIKDAASIISSLAAGSDEQGVQLLLIIPDLLSIVEALVSCPQNNNFQNSARKESYRIIANLCACNSTVLSKIIDANSYGVLLSFIDYYQRNSQARWDNKLRKYFEEIYEHCCNGVCFAIHGSTFQQINYYLNKNLLHYLHNILKKPPNDDIALEVLTGYERLLDATELDSGISTINLSQLAQYSQFQNIMQFLTHREMHRLRGFLGHKNLKIRDTARTIHDYVQLKSNAGTMI